MRTLFVCLCCGFLGCSGLPSIEPIKRSRPAEPIVAIWVETLGIGGGDGLITAVWPDSTIVWSMDKLNGGPPYRHGVVDLEPLSNAIDQLNQTGALSASELRECHFGPESTFTGIQLNSIKPHLTIDVYGNAGFQFRPPFSEYTNVITTLRDTLFKLTPGQGDRYTNTVTFATNFGERTFRPAE